MSDKSIQAVSAFNKWAQHYQEKYADVSAYADALDFFCDRVEKINANILDLACGPGNVSSYLLHKRPDFILLGTDLSENMIQLAKNANPSADFAVMDAREVDKLGKAFDGIVISFLLPYLDNHETDDLIGHCAKILQEGGLIYLSAIEGDYVHSGPQKSSKGDIVYMHFYSEADLLALFKKHDLTVLYGNKVNTTMANGEDVVDLIFVVKKEQAL